jgi:hypothetical protein
MNEKARVGANSAAARAFIQYVAPFSNRKPQDHQLFFKIIQCLHYPFGMHTFQNRTYLKKASKASLRRCGSAQNAHILPCMLRFFAVPRLALSPDPHF